MTKAKADYIFLGILGLCIAATLSDDFSGKYLLTYYHYTAFICWALTLLLRIFIARAGRYATGIILALAAMNFLNFSIVKTTSSFGINGLGALGVDPFMFCLLIVYYIVNKKSVNRIIRTLFRGSEKDQSENQQKLIDFYLQKFGDCTHDEFEQLYTKINDYPNEAQIALKQIYRQRQNPA